MDLNGQLDFSENTFNATVCGGAFTVSHVLLDSFKELIRITKPGGHIIFSVRSDTEEAEDYIHVQEILEKEGKWHLVELSEIFQSLPLKEPKIEKQVFVYRVMS